PLHFALTATEISRSTTWSLVLFSRVRPPQALIFASIFTARTVSFRGVSCFVQFPPVGPFWHNLRYSISLQIINTAKPCCVNRSLYRADFSEARQRLRLIHL